MEREWAPAKARRQKVGTGFWRNAREIKEMSNP
jgi:hypothetical protein